MSTHTEHYHFLDLVRAIGILQVVLFHVVFGVFSYGGSDAALALIEQLPTWMTFAWQPFGVDAIFLVSSFLLTSTLLDEHARFGRIDVRSFVLKRLSRILPLYYLALLLFQLGSPFDPLQFALSAVFLGVTLGVGNVIPVGWSMEVMMLFFLLMPVAVNSHFEMHAPLAYFRIGHTDYDRVSGGLFTHIRNFCRARVFGYVPKLTGVGCCQTFVLPPVVPFASLPRWNGISDCVLQSVKQRRKALVAWPRFCWVIRDYYLLLYARTH